MIRRPLLPLVCLALLAGCTRAPPPPPPEAPSPTMRYDLRALAAPELDVLTLGAARFPVGPRLKHPRLSVAHGLWIVVSLPQQRLYLLRDGRLIDSAPVSTGKPGHGTPTGTFRILQKDIHHRSNKYSDAPMPYMQRLTEGGVALHAGALPGYPASHGCIRMPYGFAKKLFGLTSFSTHVIVTRGRPHYGATGSGDDKPEATSAPVSRREPETQAPAPVAEPAPAAADPEAAPPQSSAEPLHPKE